VLEDKIVQRAVVEVLNAIYGAPGKSGASSGCKSRTGKGQATPPGIEPWAYGGNDMS
jgi:hypothetical protein